MKKILNFKSLISVKKGFTLIELLIVIAVLGILAAVILVAIDPVEQLARGRDSARKNIVVQLGRAVELYRTAQTGGSYPAEATWVADLVASRDIRTTPSSSTNIVTACTGGNKPVNSEICYQLDTSVALDHRIAIYMKSESRTEGNKCAGGSPNSWIAYLSAYGKGGSFCKASEPLPVDPNTFVE